jgi:hypothetical protein
VEELLKDRQTASEEIENLRQELTELEFGEFYLPVVKLPEFLSIVFKPAGNPEYETLVRERAEEAMLKLREHAVHKSSIEQENDGMIVAVEQGNHGEYLCEIYNDVIHKGRKRYRMNLVPVDLAGE